MARDLGQWEELFKDVAKRLATELLDEAKQESQTYGEATKYIKQIRGRAYGDITDPENNAGRLLNDAACGLAIRYIHDEERSLPIMRGESND